MFQIRFAYVSYYLFMQLKPECTSVFWGRERGEQGRLTGLYQRE